MGAHQQPHHPDERHFSQLMPRLCSQPPIPDANWLKTAAQTGGRFDRQCDSIFPFRRAGDEDVVFTYLYGRTFRNYSLFLSVNSSRLCFSSGNCKAATTKSASTLRSTASLHCSLERGNVGVVYPLPTWGPRQIVFSLAKHLESAFSFSTSF